MIATAVRTPSRIAAGALVALAATYLIAVWTAWGQQWDTSAMWEVSILARESGLDWVSELWLELVSPMATFMGALAVITVALRLRGGKAAALVAVSIASTLAASEVLKGLLVRPDWFDSASNSLPSGHVSAVAALAVGLFLAVPSASRPMVGLLGLLAVIATGLATTSLGWHRPSDSVASALLAISVAASVTTATVGDHHTRKPIRPLSRHS